MKIVQIRGGLGNQMFQYAFAVALKQKYSDEEVLIDTQLYRFPIVKTFKGNNFYHNGFEVDKIFPNATIRVASWWQIVKVSYYVPNYILNRIVRRFLPQRKYEYIQPPLDAYLYDNSALMAKEASYFEGYWFSPLFYDFCKKKIWEEFKFRPFKSKVNLHLLEMLKKDNSVTVHIRRGDFLNIDYFKDICTLDYYYKAITEAKKFLSKPMFFIFSNDLEWCKINLKDVLNGDEVIFVANNVGKESYRDMQLMSLARCNILANSSFSWWGAYLNQRNNHIVFAPKIWVNMPCDDVFCEEWIKI